MVTQPRIRIDTYSRQVFVHDIPVRLRAQEWNLLEALSPGKAVSGDELAIALAGKVTPRSRGLVRVNVQRIRRVLGWDCIATLHSFGYRFDG